MTVGDRSPLWDQGLEHSSQLYWIIGKVSIAGYHLFFCLSHDVSNGVYSTESQVG